MENKKKLFCLNFSFEKKLLYISIISFMTLIFQKKCDIFSQLCHAFLLICWRCLWEI